jgi:glycosyltransferase involved in cell wall biosynthesis
MSSNDICLSIIIPVYNVRQYLPRCIDSVVKQKYRNLDILLIDDGSTDGSGDICDQYQSRDSRIRVVHLPHGGVSAARNCGVANAAGDLITFADSDDRLAEDAYTKVIENYRNTNADILIFGFYRVTDANIPEKTDFFTEDRVMTKYEALNYLIEDTLIGNHLWNKIFKKEVFHNCVFPAGKLYEDVYVMHTLFLNASLVSIICDYNYYYYYRERSITKSHLLQDDIEDFASYYKRFNDLKNDDNINQQKLILRVFRSAIDMLCAYPLQIRHQEFNNVFKFLREHISYIKEYKYLLTRKRDIYFLKMPFFLYIVQAVLVKIYKELFRKITIT